MRNFGLVSLAVVISLIALKYWVLPYFWISLCWSLVSVYYAISNKKPVVRAVWLNICVVVVALAVFEAYLWVAHTRARSQTVHAKETFAPPEFKVSHQTLGFAPKKNYVGIAEKYYGDELVYEAKYTIDENGLRIAPPHRREQSLGCVLFFGGSFTFGYGVNDEEAMPYRVGIKLDGISRIYNFGFNAYSAHQMLAALEQDLVANIIDCDPDYVIYQAITAHVRRVVGKGVWNRPGPRYRLDERGKVILDGHFEDVRLLTIASRIADQLDKSWTYRMAFGTGKAVTHDDLKLYVAIVDAARAFVRSGFKKAEFHVLLSTGEDHEVAQALSRLKTKGVLLHVVTDILPESNHWDSMYLLSTHDSHPNALAHDIIADYVVNKILRN